MHSDSIAVAPVLMESIYKDVKRGRADKLNGLWNPCGSSAMFDSEMLLGLVENGMYITQCYGMTETCGDGLVNYAQAEPHIRRWASRTATVSTSWMRPARSASGAAV